MGSTSHVEPQDKMFRQLISLDLYQDMYMHCWILMYTWVVEAYMLATGTDRTLTASHALEEIN